MQYQLVATFTGASIHIEQMCALDNTELDVGLGMELPDLMHQRLPSLKRDLSILFAMEHECGWDFAGSFRILHQKQSQVRA